MMEKLDKDLVTVFVPTNDALKDMSISCGDAVAKHHIIPAVLCLNAIDNFWFVNTLNNEHVRITRKDGEFTVDGQRVVARDLIASNGVVHIIESVMMPDSGKEK